MGENVLRRAGSMIGAGAVVVGVVAGGGVVGAGTASAVSSVGYCYDDMDPGHGAYLCLTEPVSEALLAVLTVYIPVAGSIEQGMSQS
ncbi:hypothetical protein [Rhodococcus triatomae]